MARNEDTPFTEELLGAVTGGVGQNTDALTGGLFGRRRPPYVNCPGCGLSVQPKDGLCPYCGAIINSKPFELV